MASPQRLPARASHHPCGWAEGHRLRSCQNMPDTRGVGGVVGKNRQVARVDTPVLQDMQGLGGGQCRPRPSGCPLLGRQGTNTTCASPLRPNPCHSHTSSHMVAAKRQSYEPPHQVGLQVAPAWVGLKKKTTQASPHSHFISDNWGSSARPLCSACWARLQGISPESAKYRDRARTHGVAMQMPE